jgi:multiple sugar transport system ATP-binding protein
MSIVTFNRVGKVYDDGTRAVSELTLQIEDGEFMILVGPSGCGKTTALRMMAGLEEITEGTISIDGKVVNDLEPQHRDIAMVFQNYALYPHMSVAQNIAFGLRMRKIPKKDIEPRVKEIARVLGLSDLLERKPKQLSGGQRQRVAMGRAIVRNPQVFLMDEPLSNLDAKLRVQMRSEVARIQQEINATTIYVTHDQVEAMTMGTRVAVMRRGLLQQCDDPQSLYDRPGNLFVATFIGSPAMNLIQCRLQRNGSGLVAEFNGTRLPLPGHLSAEDRLSAYVDRDVAVGIRPEALEDAALVGDIPPECRLSAKAIVTEALGAEKLVHFEIEARPVVTEDVVEAAEEPDVARLQESDEAMSALIVGRFDTASKAQPGARLDVAVDVRNLHLFDLETGRRL